MDKASIQRFQSQLAYTYIISSSISKPFSSETTQINMNYPHVLILPYPVQGHVIPLMELSHCLISHGFKITFINTEFNHSRIMSSLSEKSEKIHENLQLASVPDGLNPGEDRNDLGRLCESIAEAMPGYIEEIIRRSSKVNGEQITWMIADKNTAWALQVAKNMGIRAGIFWPAAAGMVATLMSIPKLIEDGLIYADGLPKNKEMIEIIPGMPKMNPNQFPWNVIPDSNTQKILFKYFSDNNEAAKLAEFIICNSFYELEPPIFTYMPSLLPVGPLVPDQQFEKSVGTFWPENLSCLNWLDKQQAKSVIYVAFGSLALLNKQQFQELALGLELTGRPFLWVVRPDLTNGSNEYPTGYKERVATRGMIVDWCPQQKVLAHPSIACFISHCGWNSTIEGVRNGVSFLCKPYFIDQYFNESYICDVWKVGLRLESNGSGMILREEIKAKIDDLLENEEIKLSSMKWEYLANESISEGGSSYNNFNNIVDAMKIEHP